MPKRFIACVAALLFLPAQALAAGPCQMSTGERGWLERALGAWRYMATERLRLPAARKPLIVVFDKACRFERALGGDEWNAEPHGGQVRLPDGIQMPAQVTSFAGNDEQSGQPFFVMALPSVWQAAGIPISGDPNGLTGVFLHEFSHTRQVGPLKPVFEAAEALHPMDEDFSDDSLQKHFQGDPAYVAVIEKERDLLYRAAAEPDAEEARALAAQALALMEARQKRWFAGEDAWWKAYDDLFLTMEGFGQWVAYAWLADPSGASLAPAAAIDTMRGSRRWWSQDVGLALFLVIDRFVPDWERQAFASEPALGIDLLRKAVGGGA